MSSNERLEIANRIKDAISKSGGYKAVSEKSGISESTLIRAATGKTDPKLIDVKAIAEVTHTSLHYLAYGEQPTSESVVLMKEAEINKIIESQYALVEKRLEALEDIFRDPKATTNVLTKANVEMIEIAHQLNLLNHGSEQEFTNQLTNEVIESTDELINPKDSRTPSKKSK